MTVDSPAPGVFVAQPDRGFRYAVDALWLVGMALTTATEAPRDALDLGTGSGVVALLLAANGIPTHGIDSYPGWSPLWAQTLARSQLAAPVTLAQRDLTAGSLGPVDLVVANPPFFAADAGPASADPSRRAARTESTATVRDFVRVGLASLRAGGRCCVVVARERETELLDEAGPPAHWFRVGRRRTLFTWFAGSTGTLSAAISVDEGDALPRAWVSAATAPR